MEISFNKQVCKMCLQTRFISIRLKQSRLMKSSKECYEKNRKKFTVTHFVRKETNNDEENLKGKKVQIYLFIYHGKFNMLSNYRFYVQSTIKKVYLKKKMIDTYNVIANSIRSSIKINFI